MPQQRENLFEPVALIAALGFCKFSCTASPSFVGLMGSLCDVRFTNDIVSLEQRCGSSGGPISSACCGQHWCPLNFPQIQLGGVKSRLRVDGVTNL